MNNISAFGMVGLTGFCSKYIFPTAMPIAFITGELYLTKNESPSVKVQFSAGLSGLTYISGILKI